MLKTERDPDTKNPLHGVRDDQNRWQFTRAELDRFAAGRSEKKVVVAYDVTGRVVPAFDEPQPGTAAS